MAERARARKCGNEWGFTLTEIMVTVFIMGIVGLGITSLLTELTKQQQAANIKSLLASQKVKIEALVKDSISWNRTIINAANAGKPEFTCLRVPPVPDPNGCADNSSAIAPFGGVLNSIALFETNDILYYDSTGTNGFDTRGRTCTGYPVNTCPIRWNIRVIHKCQTTSPCTTPTTRIIAEPEMTPNMQEYFHFTLNPANYRVDVTRGIGTRFDPILITEVLPGAGAGRCGAGGPPYTATRQLNQIIQDPATNVAAIGGSAFTLNPGSYQCRITAPAFKVGTHFIELVDGGGTIMGTSSPSSSPRRYSVPSNAILEVAFTITAATSYRVVHHCEFNSYATPVYPGETTNLNQQLGFTTAIPANYGTTNVTYTTVSCYRNG